jgi:hypothetical protein
MQSQNWPNAQYRIPDETPPRTTRSDAPSRGGPLRLWYALTSPEPSTWNPDFATRERVRRGRLISTIGLGFLVILLVAAPIGLSDFPTLLALSGAIVGTLIALALNRAGWVSIAGALFVVAVEVMFMYGILSAPAGKLDIAYLPLFSMLSFGLLIGVSVLPAAMVFVIAALNTIFVIAAFNLMPATPAVQRVLDSPDRYTLIAQPIGLYLITSIIAYLWVRSTTTAIRRADRAEEIAALEHSMAEQKRQLDVEIQQILQTHVRVANGDYTARAPLGQNSVLWQIASSLNNLLSRLLRSGRAEFQLHRTEEEAHRLVAAIDDGQAGRKPIWPAPSGTVIDIILERVRGARRAGLQQSAPGQLPSTGAAQPLSGFPAGSSWSPQESEQQTPPAWVEGAQRGGPPQSFERNERTEIGEAAQSTFQEANPWLFQQDDR